MSAIPSDRLLANSVRESFGSSVAPVRRYDPEQPEQFLNAVQKRLLDYPSSEGVRSTMEDLFLNLEQWRLQADADRWNELIVRCRRHSLRELVHQDPFTYRAYHKPRGYAGDAVMMDYIYGREELWTPPETTELGQRIFDYTTSAPASEGVRARRGYDI